MGSGRFDSTAYRAFASTTTGKSTHEIYTSRNLHKSLDPMGVTVRESRDSQDNPKSTPLIVALDVTGSMGMLADKIAREGLGTLFQAILDKKPISDPHVMFMGIGDANCDRAPLQVSQFEADMRIVEQLTNLWLEGGGGGNMFESYNLAWHFAAFHTVHDSMEKRGKRGYLFTVGDEQTPAPLTRDQIKRITGADLEEQISTQNVLAMAQRSYDVYHIIIEEGSHARSHLPQVQEGWRTLLGQKAISLADYTKLSETIVSIIDVAEGRDAAESARGWGDVGTRGVVYDAIKHLPRGTGNTPRLGRP